MRTPAVPPASLFYSSDRNRNTTRVSLVSVLPWGEIFVAGVLLSIVAFLG